MEAIVEIPAHSYLKYEIKNNQLTVDRILKLECPANYGFIPNTLCEDGDPLDIFIIAPQGITPSAKVNLSIIGGFKCTDNGDSDDKLIGVIEGYETYLGVGNNLPYYIEKIKYYLSKYKEGFFVHKEYSLQESFEIFEQSKDYFLNEKFEGYPNG